MMRALDTRTNGDVVAPVVDRAKAVIREAVEHFKAHPDELAIGIAPWLLLTMATRRHKLNFAEAALISECAFWSGVFAVEAYRNWKDKPAGTAPRLRKVN